MSSLMPVVTPTGIWISKATLLPLPSHSSKTHIHVRSMLMSNKADIDINMSANGKRTKAKMLHLLKQGTSLLKILEHMEVVDPVEYWTLVHHLIHHKNINQALQVFKWWKNQAGYKTREEDYSPFLDILRKARLPSLAQNIFDEMKYEGIQPSLSTMSTLMLFYAECGIFDQAQTMWNDITKCGFQPDTVTCIELIHAYGEMGLLDAVARIFEDMKCMGYIINSRIYIALMTCYGKGEQLEMVETVLEEMLSSGLRFDSPTANAIVQSYSFAGSLTMMEEKYRQVKACGICMEGETIRAMASAYIRNQKFHQLGEFVKDLGLKRKTVGNLLWNMLLLSYAANFKMRCVQTEFLNMLEAGFEPDLTTFNIRALAFSRMQMFWDLHITVLHMKHVNIAPDLVTYGAIVDAYLQGRMVKKLSYALDEIGINNLYPNKLTDPLVYEAFGKGDFHASSENLLKYSNQKNQGRWTYSKLLRFHLKKHFRGGQMFWNH